MAFPDLNKLDIFLKLVESHIRMAKYDLGLRDIAHLQSDLKDAKRTIELIEAQLEAMDK